MSSNRRVCNHQGPPGHKTPSRICQAYTVIPPPAMHCSAPPHSTHHPRQTLTTPGPAPPHRTSAAGPKKMVRPSLSSRMRSNIL